MTIEEKLNSERIVEYFLNAPEKLMELSREEGKDVMQLASVTAAKCDDIRLQNKCLELLYNCCFYMKEIDLREQWNIYWILTRAVFKDYKVKINGNLDELYKLIYKEVEKSVEGTFERTDKSGSNLVVIITNQFLEIGHAPTKRVLDYSYTIATSLKKQIMIVNDSSFHFYPCRCLDQSLCPVFKHDYDFLETIIYKGMEIPFMQFSGYMPDVYGINEMLQIIYQMQPELIYNISDSCLTADLCGKFTKTASMPCGNNIPVTMSEYLLVGRSLEDKDKMRLSRLEPYQKVIETVINYESHESNIVYERANFGIQNESFVVGIIGNRLDEDITDEVILLTQLSQQIFSNKACINAA